MKCMLQICLIAIVINSCGCAWQKTILSETVSADGSYTKTTRAVTKTFFDAKNNLTRLKTSSTDKTQSIGIDGLNQEASGTNIVGGMKAAGELLGVAARTFVTGGAQ